MRIAVASDLHLEYHEATIPRSLLAPLDAGEADVLVLAGDVSTHTEDVVRLAERLRPDLPVVAVLGNHEHYDRVFGRTLGEFREALAGFPGWRYLEREAVVIGGVRFLGTTLWTDFLGGKQADACVRELADFYVISEDDDKWLRPPRLIEEYRQNVKWLTGELESPYAGPAVVITHHAPSFRSNPKRFQRSEVSGAFCADLDGLIELYQPALWIHGHLHDPADYRIGGTRVVCNPRGVPGEEREGGKFGLQVVEVARG